MYSKDHVPDTLKKRTNLENWLQLPIIETLETVCPTANSISPVMMMMVIDIIKISRT